MDKLNFATVGVNINDKGKADEIATPINICNDMTELFPSESFNDTSKIWADIYCKTGNTLKALKQHGVPKENIVAICPTPQCQLFACRQLYGKLLPEVKIDKQNKYPDVAGVFNITRRGQVYYISNWKEIVTGKVSNTNALTIINKIILNEMRSEMSLEFTSENGFKFNNIIMNPPYNNDMYLDFVTLAHKIATDNVVAITPAKWQAKGGAKNEQFRKDIVPYMKEIVYYPDCTDIFIIQEPDGICIYLMDKNIHIKKSINNICFLNNKLNGYEIRAIENTLLNGANEIINKVKEIGFTRFNPTKYRVNSYNVFTNDSIAIGGKAHKDVNGIRYTYILSNQGNFMCISKSEITENDNDPLVKNSCLTFSSERKEDCNSFIKWTETKFVRFLFFAGLLARNSIGTDYGWRFVPAPKAFDHIFTDQELYKEYNLTDEEIDIIESVIKERK